MEENPIFANKNKYGLDKLLCLGNFCFSFGYRQRWRRNKKYFLVIGLFIDPYPVSKLTKTSIQALDFCVANLVERQTLDWMGKIKHMMASNLQIFYLGIFNWSEFWNLLPLRFIRIHIPSQGILPGRRFGNHWFQIYSETFKLGSAKAALAQVYKKRKRRESKGMRLRGFHCPLPSKYFWFRSILPRNNWKSFVSGKWGHQLGVGRAPPSAHPLASRRRSHPCIFARLE